jgi:hypothetical protein
MKDYLGIDGNALDGLVASFIGLAKEIVEKVLRFPIANFKGEVPSSVKEAMKFIVASYYTNREQTNAEHVESTAALMMSHVRLMKF